MIRSGGRGPRGLQGIQGEPGADGTNGTNGTDGVVPVYNSSGLMPGVKMWIGSATTNASGQWSVNYSSAGFTSPPHVRPLPISSANTASAALSASITAPTTTTASGACFLPNAIALLGILPLQAAGAGITVQVIAVGT